MKHGRYQAEMRSRWLFVGIIVLGLASSHICLGATKAHKSDPVVQGSAPVITSAIPIPGQFVIYDGKQVTGIYVAPEDSSTVRTVANAFAGDIQAITGKRPATLEFSGTPLPKHFVLMGVIGHCPLLDRLRIERRVDTSSIEGQWESAITAVVQHPFPNVDSVLVIAGSDRRGAAYAVFDLSRQMGVSPWNWWADVPVRHHTFLAVRAGVYMQASPSVQYRGIFLNDEDWGLRPWAAAKMDPDLHNIGPHTYERIFELLLRLRANTLWPAMHPGTLPFNAVPENAVLADRWGIVMGSSHSEALLRNNVGEWSEKRDGAWNYQTNAAAINKYWDERLQTNGRFENFYTVGMRGVHDSGLEATGSPEVKAKLVETIIDEQQRLLASRVNRDVSKIPQVLWLYKESLGLYRVGMKVPEDVALGWTDDNYGYIRELPNSEEQARSGGSALYYHVSYWGAPHDYLWLCSTPPSLMREELAKAWHHGVRRLWIVNVGDLKPAEIDIDYFLRMAWNESATERMTQREFLADWNREQLPAKYADSLASLMERYYELSFIRKPEFMAFNENEKPIERSAFNPLAWGDQNRQRLLKWQSLSSEATSLGQQLPSQYRDSYFELIGYPILAAAAQNAKFLLNDRTYLEAAESQTEVERSDARKVQSAYDRVQSLTAQYNSLAAGKWNGIMSCHPRKLRVFDMPITAEETASSVKLPTTWGAPGALQQVTTTASTFAEKWSTVSISAVHFSAMHDTAQGSWNARQELGLPGGSVFFGTPGETPEARWVTAGLPQSNDAVSEYPWLQYQFETAADGNATLSLYLLPTFPVDSHHRLRYAVTLDGKTPIVLDASGTEEHREGITPWASNVLRNAEIQSVDLGDVRRGKHTLRLIYGDPGVIFQHIVVAFSGAPPAYPFPPETNSSQPRRSRKLRASADSFHWNQIEGASHPIDSVMRDHKDSR